MINGNSIRYDYSKIPHVTIPCIGDLVTFKEDGGEYSSNGIFKVVDIILSSKILNVVCVSVLRGRDYSVGREYPIHISWLKYVGHQKYMFKEQIGMFNMEAL